MIAQRVESSLPLPRRNLRQYVTWTKQWEPEGFLRKGACAEATPRQRRLVTSLTVLLGRWLFGPCRQYTQACRELADKALRSSGG